MVKNKQGNKNMTQEQEDKIIRQAQDILERRLGKQEDLKVDLKNVMYYSAFHLGALIALSRVTEELVTNKPKKSEDWIYRQAEWRLITSSKRNMQLFLEQQPMRYRNHKRGKNGKLESVECYFVEYKTVITEVK